MKYDYEAFHEKYPVDIHDQPARHLKIAELCKGVVYDVGCGTGTLSDYWAGEYRGWDISKAGIAKANELRRGSAQFLQADCESAEALTFAHADTIVMSEFLEHIESDENLIKKIFATAKIGARIIVSVPNGDAIPCDEHVRQFTVPELRKKFAKFGRVRFYNWEGAKRQIIMTCDLGIKDEADLALVMICKNEEKGIENAILSALEVVSFVRVCVDDKTTDQTEKIAKKYADEVKMITFKNDFARARNEAHEGIEQEWRIFLDGHEYIEKFEGVAELLGKQYDGLMCQIRMDNGMEFGNPRIYKKGVQFVGAVHEKQECKIVGRADGVLIQHDRLGSQSEAATAERKKQRDEMMNEIMREQVKADPGNRRALFHLALWAWSTKRNKEAVKWGKQYLKYSKFGPERWFVRFTLALAYLAEGKLVRAFWQADLAEDEEDNRWETRKLKGLICFQKKRYGSAIEYFVDSFDKGRRDVFYKPWTRDHAGTWNAIGECYFRLGNYEKGAISFAEAGRATKDKKVQDFFLRRAALMADMAKAGMK